MSGRTTAQMRGVALLGGSALVFRAFALAAIDLPGSRPGLWLSAAVAALLALPAALRLTGRREGESLPPLRAGRWNTRAACALIGVLSLHDAAVSARLFSALAVCAALPDHATAALSLPLTGAAAAACLMGAGAMSAVAVVWRRVALALAAAMLLAQARVMRPDWLFPLLGAGAADIILGAERAAGPMALAALGVDLLGEGGAKAGRRAFRALIWAALICVGAVAAYEMLIPAMPSMPSGRPFRLEILVSSGQNGFAAEIIYVLMMAGGMLLAGFELLTAAAALNAALPQAAFPVCALLCAAAMAILCASFPSGEDWARALMPWYYPLALLAAGLAALPRGRGEAAA